MRPSKARNIININISISHHRRRGGRARMATRRLRLKQPQSGGSWRSLSLLVPCLFRAPAFEITPGIHTTISPWRHGSLTAELIVASWRESDVHISCPVARLRSTHHRVLVRRLLGQVVGRGGR